MLEGIGRGVCRCYRHKLGMGDEMVVMGTYVSRTELSEDGDGLRSGAVSWAES